MKKCLLIVDVQVGFINESTQHIPNLVEVLQHKYKYVYVTRFFNEKNSFYRSLIKWDRFSKESTDFSLAFKPKENATLIDKNIYSCINAKFLYELHSKKITKVDICGLDTDICVIKCAVDLFENKVEPRVLANYCASHAGDEFHRNGLLILERYIGRSQIKS